MKNIEEIIHDVMNGVSDYININDCIKIAKLYANQKLEEAAEKTNLEFGLRKNSAFATIVKQSILNLREEA